MLIDHSFLLLNTDHNFAFHLSQNVTGSPLRNTSLQCKMQTHDIQKQTLDYSQPVVHQYVVLSVKWQASLVSCVNLKCDDSWAILTSKQRCESENGVIVKTCPNVSYVIVFLL